MADAFAAIIGRYGRFFRNKTRDNAAVAERYLRGLAQAQDCTFAAMADVVDNGCAQQFQHFIVTPKRPGAHPRPGEGLCSGRRHPDNSMIKAAGGTVRVRRMFQPCLRAVERTERRVAKVSAPPQVRKPPDIFIFTFIMRISCSA